MHIKDWMTLDGKHRAETALSWQNMSLPMSL